MSETDLPRIAIRKRVHRGEFELSLISAARFLNVSGIYGLECPDTARIAYVGQSVCILRRYIDHCDNKRTQNMAKVQWVDKLKARGLLPILRIIEICRPIDLLFEERKHIYRALENGEAWLNIKK